MNKEIVKKLSDKLDKETADILNSLPEVKRPKFAIMGDLENSPFLCTVKRKADLLGLKYDIYPSDSRRTFYMTPAVYDRESCMPLLLDKAADLDNAQHDGMSSVAEAVYLLLKHLSLIKGKNIAIVGRGHSAKGLAKKLIDEDATVTVAHSKTSCLLSATKGKDVVIYATPKVDKIIAYDTESLVIDLGNCVEHPEWFYCDYLNRIGQLTASVLLHRLVK